MGRGGGGGSGGGTRGRRGVEEEGGAGSSGHVHKGHVTESDAQGPVRSYRVLLPAYAMSGTDLACAPTCLRNVRY
eukprot:2789039-Rhodomonas_salina.2